MIKIVCFGRRNEGWVEEVIREYGKRMTKYWRVEWQITDEKNEEKIVQSLNDYFLVVLDEQGKSLSSEEFSGVLAGKIREGRRVCLIIGGAYGVSEVTRGRADVVLSLSRMVFAHQLCRAILAEQVYRAQEIAAGGPYHHG